MTNEEKLELQRIAALAIQAVQENIANGPQDELTRAMHEVEAWRWACYDGVRESLQTAGDIDANNQLDPDHVLTKFSVRDLITAVMVSVSIGMDIAVEMHRLGAKFPKPRVN